MKYVFQMRSQPDEGEEVSEKHARFMEAVMGITGPWAPRPGPVPRAEDPEDELESVSLTKVLGRRSDVTYPNRWGLEDRSSSDDVFTLDFNPEKFDLRSLAYEVLPRLVVAFGAYAAYIGDEEFIFKDFEGWQEWSNAGHNERHEVFQLRPVNFFSGALCRSAFGLAPNEVVARVKGDVEHAAVHEGGLLLVLSSAALPFAESEALCHRAESLLPRPPGRGTLARTRLPRQTPWPTLGEALAALDGGAVLSAIPPEALPPPSVAALRLDQTSGSAHRAREYFETLLPLRDTLGRQHWRTLRRWWNDYWERGVTGDRFA